MKKRKLLLFKIPMMLVMLSFLFTGFKSYSQEKALVNHSLVSHGEFAPGQTSTVAFTWSCSTPDNEWIEDLIVTFPEGTVIEDVSDLNGYAAVVNGHQIHWDFQYQSPFTDDFTVTFKTKGGEFDIMVNYWAEGDYWGAPPNVVEGFAMVYADLPANYITSFGFDYIGVGADFAGTEITTSIPYHISRDTLTAFFELEAANSVARVNGDVQESGVDQVDFTEPVVYSVADSNGLTRDYTVHVTKSEPLTGFTLSSAIDGWMYNDTIELVIPANQDVTTQVVEFTMADADYILMVANVELQTGVTEIDVTDPVTLTAVAGDFEKDYTLIVNTENPLNEFNFTSYVNAEGETVNFAMPVYGMIDAETMTIDLEVPYGTPMDALIASFNVADYVSEVAYNNLTLTSGVTDADYTSSASLVLTLADPVKADPMTFTVNVTEGDGSSDNEILNVWVPNLAEPLVWDQYGRTIEGVIMYDSAMSVQPVFEISPLATIEDTTQAYDFTTGPVTYTVTSQNGTEAEWVLTLTEAAASTETEIYSFAHDLQANWWMEDTTIVSVASADLDLANVDTKLELSFGANSTPSQVSNTTVDFTSQPVIYTVTAQDGETTQAYSVYIVQEEEDAPVVTVEAAEYSNVYDSVPVSYTDASNMGYFGVGIFHKSLMDDIYSIVQDPELREEAEENGELRIIETMVASGNTDFLIPAEGLKPGIFYGIGGDMFGNMSEVSTDSAVIYRDTMMVASFDEMEYFDNVIYKYTGNAVVTYAQSYRHQKFVQDETMGMLIDDYYENVSDTVIEGDMITNIYGKMVDYEGTIEFQPVQITEDSAMVVSRGNVVEPLELTMDEFNESTYMYQNMLVKLTDVTFPQADGANYFSNGGEYIINNVDGTSSFLGTNFWNVDYIGDTLPEGIWNIVGIKNVYNHENEDDSILRTDAVITPRNWDDMMLREGYVFNITPEDYTFSLIGVGNDMKEYTISNTGIESFDINHIYIEGDNEFRVDLLEDIFVDAYSEYNFMVYFEPEDFGSYAATLYVELSDGMVYETALNGEVVNIPVADYPYSTDFDTQEAITGWTINNLGSGAGFQWGEGLQDGGTSFYRVGYNNPSYPDNDEAYIVSPPIDLSNAVAPVLSWNNTMINAGSGWSYCGLFVSVNGQPWIEVSEIVTNNLAGTVVLPPTLLQFDVSAYAGESNVQFIFYINEPPTGANSPVTWWEVDDFALVESPTMPIFAVNTDSIGMGVVDGAASFDIVIENDGASYFTLNSVSLQDGSSAAFTLTGAVDAPFDVYEQDTIVTVNYDGTLDLQEAVVLVDYTDPRMGNMVKEIPVSAMGVSCSAPMAAVEGENEAPYAPSWFEFTPTEDALITVTSCGDYVDTDVEVYAGCDGIMVAGNDDDGNCEMNPFASTASWAAKAGVTYVINWLPTWSASGFTWTISTEALPTAPELLTIDAMATSASTANVTVTFDEMLQIDPDTKSAQNSKISGRNVNITDVKRSAREFNKVVANAKDFTPDGDPEVEPNDGSLNGSVAQEVTLGTEDEPLKITGHYGGPGDAWDEFEFTLEEASYVNVTAELAGGEVYLWVVNSDYSGSRVASDGGLFVTNNYGGDLIQPGTYYIILQPLVAAEEPGIGYNLKGWTTQPPTFTVYRDALEIANGPMAFEYTDEGVALDEEVCYTVTQELYDGSESEQSNELCITPQAGEGDVCVYAIPVSEGKYMAPRAPYWYKFTPTETVAVKVSSNIEENALDNDTRIFIYEDCNITEPGNEENTDWIAWHDDMDSDTDWFTSEVEFVAAAGETYILYWDNKWSSDPFTFEVTTSAMKEGDYVENAIPVELPLVDFAGSTAEFTHNYDATACNEAFMQGKDVCYSFSIPYGGTISGGIEGEWVGMHVIKGKPGTDNCIASASGSAGGTFANEEIMPGDYTIIISTQLPTEETDFVMDLEYTPAAKEMLTFNVDMNVQITLGNFDPAVDSLDIVGTFNFWEHTVNMTDADADGVYTYELPTEYNVGEKLRYKYRINGMWETAELSNDVNVYRTWTIESGTNETDDLYDNQEMPVFNVTFRVAMARQIELGNFVPGDNVVGITTPFVSYPVSLTDADGDFIYEAVVKGVEYGEINYQYNIDGTDEEVDMRNAMITENTVLTAWYNDNSSVSVGTNVASMIEIYPNPSQGEFTVDFGVANTENVNVELVNLEGQVIKVIELNSNSVVDVDITEFAKGVYYLRINDGNNVNIKKVVVE